MCFLLCIRRSCLAAVLLLSCKGGVLICLDLSSILQNGPVTSSWAVATVSPVFFFFFILSKPFFFIILNEICDCNFKTAFYFLSWSSASVTFDLQIINARTTLKLHGSLWCLHVGWLVFMANWECWWKLFPNYVDYYFAILFCFSYLKGSCKHLKILLQNSFPRAAIFR